VNSVNRWEKKKRKGPHQKGRGRQAWVERSAGVTDEHRCAWEKYKRHVIEQGHFSVITAHVWTSNAYQALGDISPIAYKILPIVFYKIHREKTQTKGGRNPAFFHYYAENEWTLSYRDLALFGLTIRQSRNALAALLEVGFIDIVRHSSGTRRGEFTKYRFSERWRAWGTENFHRSNFPLSHAQGFRKKRKVVDLEEAKEKISKRAKMDADQRSKMDVEGDGT
jgi:hypothetical protein